MTEPTDAELDTVLCNQWPAFSMQATLVRVWVRAAMRDALAKWGTPPTVAGEPVAKLWLWKNFVGGKPEYWAFDNPFPCVSVGGDPLTLGEPCGWALFKPSVNGRPQHSEQEVVNTVYRLHATPQPTQAQAGAVPDWVKYDTTNRILIIKGQRYAEELFDHDAAYAKSNQAWAVPQPPVKLGPDGKEWAKTEAGYAHVDEMLPRADGHCIGPFWYGWALRGAFVAGAEWQEARQIGGIKGGQHGADT